MCGKVGGAGEDDARGHPLLVLLRPSSEALKNSPSKLAHYLTGMGAD